MTSGGSPGLPKADHISNTLDFRGISQTLILEGLPAKSKGRQIIIEDSSEELKIRES